MSNENKDQSVIIATTGEGAVIVHGVKECENCKHCEVSGWSPKCDNCGEDYNNWEPMEPSPLPELLTQTDNNATN